MLVGHVLNVTFTQPEELGTCGLRLHQAASPANCKKNIHFKKCVYETLGSQ